MRSGHFGLRREVSKHTSSKHEITNGIDEGELCVELCHDDGICEAFNSNACGDDELCRVL